MLSVQTKSSLIKNVSGFKTMGYLKLLNSEKFKNCESLAD